MKREETVGFMIKTLNSMIMRNEMSALKSVGCTEQPFIHGWIIGFLYENRDKEIYQKDLEAVFSIARSTVTNIVKQMEKNGYITRVPVDRDSRLKRLTLTKKGEESHEKVEETFRRVEEKICQGIAPEDIEIFLKVARQIRVNVARDASCNEIWRCNLEGSVQRPISKEQEEKITQNIRD